MDEILNAGSAWLKIGENANVQGTGVEDFAESLLGIGQILVAVGFVTMLIVTAITALRWITATPDKKAALQKQLIGLVVAGVVIFGAVGIWSIVRGIMEKVEDSIQSGTSGSGSSYYTPGGKSLDNATKTIQKDEKTLENATKTLQKTDKSLDNATKTLK